MWMSVRSQSQCAQKSTRSVSTIKAATRASALKATRSEMGSVCKHNSQVRMSVDEVAQCPF